MTLIERHPEAASDITREKFRWGTLLVVLSGVFMTILDFFIVNVAIPATSADLQASPQQVQWIVAGFGLAVGSGVITAGRLGDIHGRRRIFGIGLALFTVTSAACGLAPNAAELVTFRIAQGASAALVMPQVLAIIGIVYTGKAFTRAITAYGLAMGLAAVFGQLIGGVLIEWDIAGLGWRLVFLINVPIGLTALGLTRKYVPESRGAERPRLDLAGVGLITAALVATVLPLIEGQSQGWPLWTWLSFALAAVGFIEFVRYQRTLTRRGGTPLIELSMFRERAFTAGVLTQLVFMVGQASFFLTLAVYLQTGRGLSALESGLVFIAIGAGYLLGSIESAALTRRLGRHVVTLGGALMVVALELMQVEVHRIGADGSIAWLLAPLFVDGFGMGLIIAPMTGLIIERVSPRIAGASSGVLSTAMQVGGAIGVAAIGIIFYNGTDVIDAFGKSLWFLLAVEAAVVALVQLMPRQAKENVRT